jgi:hypothetical protein
MTTTLTLAEARALAARLQAEQDAAEAAEAASRREAELRVYSEAFNELCPQARQARDAAAAPVIEQLANTDTLDINDVFTAFVTLRDLDAKAGSVGVFASMIESVAPLPDNAIGAKMGRPPGVAELYDRTGFAQFCDLIISKRADRIRRQHLTELQAAAFAEIDKAGADAKAAAAQHE